MPNTETTMLMALLLAMLLGLVGQGLRAIAGVKKLSDDAAKDNKTLSSVFDTTAFMLSLFVGALAGMAAYLGLYFSDAMHKVDLTEGTTLLGVVAAGYAGADFIEAFAKKYLPVK